MSALSDHNAAVRELVDLVEQQAAEDVVDAMAEIGRTGRLPSGWTELRSQPLPIGTRRVTLRAADADDLIEFAAVTELFASGDEDALAAAAGALVLRDVMLEEEVELVADVTAQHFAHSVALRGAEQALHERTLPGRTPAVGSIAVPGFEPIPFEPARLIRHNGFVIETRHAKPHHLGSAARRAADQAALIAILADRFAEWSTELRDSGADPADLTFERFLLDAGYLNDREAP